MPALAPKRHQSNSPPPPPPQQSFSPQDVGATSALSEPDIDRLATLFSPATPPATPRLVSIGEHPPRTATVVRPRKSTQSSSDSDFGAFVSVPAAQDPLARGPDHASLVEPQYVSSSNHSLVYFDQFTTNAKTAVERNKREVLDELLRHQDDPLYFLDTDTQSTTTSTACPTPDPTSTCPAAPIPMPIIMSTDEALAEALASDMSNPKFVWAERGRSVKVAPSPSRSRLPLPPHLSGNASPPSHSSPSASTTPLPTPLLTSSPPPSSSTSTLSSASAGAYPAHATLSRLSSSLVSLLPSRPRSRTQTHSRDTSTSAPSTSTSTSTSTGSTGTWFHSHAHAHTTSTALTHGSPFSVTPYVPSTGAPGFAGDRAWDRRFSGLLAQEEERRLVDPVELGLGLGPTHAHAHAHAQHGNGKAKGVSLFGRREGTVGVLTQDMADLIRPYLPALTKLPRTWTLLYSLDQHGISLNTLYARCKPLTPTRAHPNPPKGALVVVRDAGGAVFGAWVGEGVRVERGGYYGSGESFLWRYHPPTDAHTDADADADDEQREHEHEHEGEGEGRLDVYKWTGVNAYVALCEPGFVSFGGGDGHYGLYLDACLLEGSSAPCPTFGNPPLCSSASGTARTKGEVSFECVGLEVWGIGSG